ncbi:hypothetical protein BRADI_1g27841v3 [Brachypodium distachyon]|uniref:Transposase (putative) gypsy type domain-containing protein n=1 Tax=Brachypodium distachyon TaxID=15368 RepID=A0A0Q3JVZ4_BRADI|nr:hypothetical protein BRADI_1g27841v3 [Brachypodium distachyon]
MGKAKTMSSKTDAGKEDADKGAIPWSGVVDHHIKILELQDDGLLSGGPDGVRIPAKDEYPRPLLGERVIFLDYMLRGLSFPLHAFFRAMLLAYGLQLHDFPPNSYLHVACFIMLCECFLGVSPHWGLWKRIFMIKGQKADTVGSVNFQVRSDAKYFSLQQRESVQSWRSKWFYVQADALGADPSLPAFSIKKKVKKTAAWNHELTSAEESEAASLMARMHSLMGMRIQPPEARVHPMWSFEGPRDPIRVNAEELSLNEVESRVRRLTTLTGGAACKIDSAVVPYGPDRPREEGLEDPLSQPPPAGEEELADESSESPDQASDSETEEVALETRRKRSRESNPKSGDQSTGVEDLLYQANSLKDAAELQSKSLEKKLADLARESAEKLEAEKRLAREASEALLAKEAEMEKTRAIRLLRGVVGPLQVIDTVASVSSEAVTGVQHASRVLTGLFGKMFPNEPVPESLARLIEFFSADPDPLDEFSRVQTNSGAESTFVLALAHSVGEDALRKVASCPPLLPSGEEVALTPYFQLGEELATQLSAQLGSMAAEGEAAPQSSTPAPSQEVGQA